MYIRKLLVSLYIRKEVIITINPNNMKVIKSRNNRQQETFKGSLDACKAYIRGIVEQLSDGNLNAWISLEYTETKAIYTNDSISVTWEIAR